MGRSNTYRVGQENFFKICDAVRTYREEIQKVCRRNSDVSDYLAKKLEFPVPESTLASAYKATGVTFEFISGRRQLQDSSANNRRIIIKSIIDLYEQLGVKVPEDLRQLQIRAHGSKPGKIISAVVPVPVSSVIPAKHVEIVSKKP